MALQPAIVLQFVGNDVLQFLFTAPGTVFTRIIDFPLGTGGDIWVSAANDRSAIYNPHDDKMYFLAEKTGGIDLGHYLIQYDPRTLAISDVMELPVGWTISNSTLIDCTDERVWISSSFDGDVRAFDTVGMTEVFADGGALSTLCGVVNAGVSCASGQILMPDALDNEVIHRITITGAATFDDDTIAVPAGIVWDNNGSFRRRWNESLGIAVLSMDGSSGTILGITVNVAALTENDFPVPPAWMADGKLANNGIFWDPFSPSNRFIGSVLFNGGQFGVGVFESDGDFLGVIAENDGDWDSGSPAMQLGNIGAGGEYLVWAASLVIPGGAAYGGFDEDVPGAIPVGVFEADSFNSDPSNILWEGVFACIAPGVEISVVPTLTTVASAGGSVGTSLNDTATLAGGDAPTGTITFVAYGPDDAVCGVPVFTSDAVVVVGNGSYVSTPNYIPVVSGVYRWRAFYSGDSGNDPVSTACGDLNESAIIVDVSPPQGGGGASPGYCGVQFERLELFKMLKSLMGGGRTLREALKFVDQDDIDFLEEEGYMDELPVEIPKPARQGGSPKMVNTRIDMTPITKLNKLVAEFETKLQDCVHRQRGEYEK